MGSYKDLVSHLNVLKTGNLKSRLENCDKIFWLAQTPAFFFILALTAFGIHSSIVWRPTLHTHFIQPNRVNKFCERLANNGTSARWQTVQEKLRQVGLWKNTGRAPPISSDAQKEDVLLFKVFKVKLRIMIKNRNYLYNLYQKVSISIKNNQY
jgi:hypothetical protein